MNNHPLVDLIAPTHSQPSVAFDPVFTTSEGIAPLVREMLFNLLALETWFRTFPS